MISCQTPALIAGAALIVLALVAVAMILLVVQMIRNPL